MKRDEIRGILDGIGESGIDSAVDRIMTINGSDINTTKAELSSVKAQLANTTAELEKIKAVPNNTDELTKQLDELKVKYETDTKALSAKLTERDYNDAVNAAITENKIKFSSKSAENYFKAELKAKNLEIADGKLKGFDEFYTSQLEADKSAFVTDEKPDKPSKFLGAPGNAGNVPDDFITRQAAKFNEKYGKKDSDKK